MERKLSFPPKTKACDYKQYLGHELALNKYLSRGLISLDEYNNLRVKLRLDFQNQLFSKDRYVFNTVEDMAEFLESLGIFNTDHMVTHENEHFRELSRRGYKPKAAVWLLNDTNLAYGPLVLTEEDVNLEDYMAAMNVNSHIQDHNLA